MKKMSVAATFRHPTAVEDAEIDFAPTDLSRSTSEAKAADGKEMSTNMVKTKSVLIALSGIISPSGSDVEAFQTYVGSK